MAGNKAVYDTLGGRKPRNHDIQGGILELEDPNYRLKKYMLDLGFLPYRINHLSWWKEELPSEAEYKEGLANIERCRREVDYIVSHCASTATQAVLGGGMFKADRLTDYFMQVEDLLQYKKWFFGHYHDNRNVDDKHILLYEQIVRIW